MSIGLVELGFKYKMAFLRKRTVGVKLLEAVEVTYGSPFIFFIIIYRNYSVNSGVE